MVLSRYYYLSRIKELKNFIICDPLFGECLRGPTYQAFIPSIVPTESNLSGIYPIINTQSMYMWAQPSPPIVGEGAGVGSVLFHLCIVITSPRLTPPPSPPLIGAGSAYGVQPIRHSSHPPGGKRGYLFSIPVHGLCAQLDVQPATFHHIGEGDAWVGESLAIEAIFLHIGSLLVVALGGDDKGLS